MAWTSSAIWRDYAQPGRFGQCITSYTEAHSVELGIKVFLLIKIIFEFVEHFSYRARDKSDLGT